MTQRKANPWLVRPSCTSAQTSHPLGDYAAKDLKFKRVAVVGDDFAFGHECVAGFQRVFEDNGGKVVQKLFTPLNAPDYGTYISQLKPNLDAVFTGHAGSNGFKFIKQLREYGNRVQILGGFTPVDESLLQQMGEDALGAITGNWYSAQLDFADQQDVRRRDPARLQGRSRRLCGRDLSVRRSARARAQADRRQGRGPRGAEQGAARSQGARHAARSGAASTSYGNVVGNVYIRKVEKKGGKYVNAVVKTYPDVSQFWTYEQGRVPEEPGLFPRLSAGEESGIVSRERQRRARWAPLPLAGRGRGWGPRMNRLCRSLSLCIAPLPNPPPQGGGSRPSFRSH